VRGKNLGANGLGAERTLKLESFGEVASNYHTTCYHEVSYLSITICKRFRLNEIAPEGWVSFEASGA